MCTVTISPKGKNDDERTSNRDETPNRIPLLPYFYAINKTEILFPKDELSGGTWIDNTIVSKTFHIPHIINE